MTPAFLGLAFLPTSLQICLAQQSLFHFDGFRFPHFWQQIEEIIDQYAVWVLQEGFELANISHRQIWPVSHAPEVVGKRTSVTTLARESMHYLVNDFLQSVASVFRHV